MKLRLTVILFAMCCIPIIGNSQEIIVKSVLMQPHDKTAQLQPCIDNNGDTCALIKIRTNNVEGLKFDNKNQYLKALVDDEWYQIYIPVTIGKKLDYRHAHYLPGQIDFSEWGYTKLRQGRTYLVVLETRIPVELESSVTLNIKPANATLVFDDEVQKPSENGTYTIRVSEGKHRYAINAKDHYPLNDDVVVGKSDSKMLSLALPPIIHNVTITCNVKKADVFVDGVKYGKTGTTLSIPQGTHIIRLQANGYVDEEKEVRIETNSIMPYFHLGKQFKQEIHIYPTAVTIYSDTPVYVNGRQIKGWDEGTTAKTIELRPGTYRLTYGKYGTKNKKVIVDGRQMTIKLQ